MQGEAIWRIPNPDYDRHPAYGELFGRPHLGLRLRALRRMLPHVAAYAAYDTVSRIRRWRARSAGPESPLFPALERDGAVGVRLDRADMDAIHQAAAPHITRLRAKMAGVSVAELLEQTEPPVASVGGVRRRKTLGELHRHLNPRSTDNEAFLHEDDAPALFSALRDGFRRQGVLAAASRYQRADLDVTHLKLLINHASDHWWRAPFADVGLTDPPAISMHVDHLWTTKAVLYMSDVGPRSGPFCYCLGSNHVRIGWLEGAARRANDRVDLSSCSPEDRRLFHALPETLRCKAKFGNDVEPDNPGLDRLLRTEHRFTSDEGDLILFDDRGIHRGGLIEDGERIMFQIRFG